MHLADISTRMDDLPKTLVALLIGEACNVGLTPVIKAGDEVLTRGDSRTWIRTMCAAIRSIRR
ncbi:MULTISPECIES: hypothetical protein [unclassified Streptosporangium]|uniref:hypothetical protein n=1 Tax=unclassified Streptosporangium TaxID=2632669 RepID=UPI002E280951|nr:MULTISPECIES: hypothetical protein [unclassified Streptosporangium]